LHTASWPLALAAGPLAPAPARLPAPGAGHWRLVGPRRRCGGPGCGGAARSSARGARLRACVRREGGLRRDDRLVGGLEGGVGEVLLQLHRHLWRADAAHVREKGGAPLQRLHHPPLAHLHAVRDRLQGGGRRRHLLSARLRRRAHGLLLLLLLGSLLLLLVRGHALLPCGRRRLRRRALRRLLLLLLRSHLLA